MLVTGLVPVSGAFMEVRDGCLHREMSESSSWVVPVWWKLSFSFINFSIYSLFIKMICLSFIIHVILSFIIPLCYFLIMISL